MIFDAARAMPVGGGGIAGMSFLRTVGGSMTREGALAILSAAGGGGMRDGRSPADGGATTFDGARAMRPAGGGGIPRGRATFGCDASASSIPPVGPRRYARFSRSRRLRSTAATPATW